MGTDFIEKTKKGFHKHLDRERAKLATANLFTREPVNVCETFVAESQGRRTFSQGDALVAEVSGGNLVLKRGLDVVAIAPDPPTAVLEAVRESCGIATAIVQDYHEGAGILEVTLC